MLVAYDQNGNCKQKTWHPSRIAGMDNKTFELIVDYIKEEIAPNLKNGKEFTMGDFAGGKNWDWTGTPLEPLFLHFYNKYDKQEKKAIKSAGRACGAILRHILITDAQHTVVQMPGWKARYQEESAFNVGRDTARNEAIDWQADFGNHNYSYEELAAFGNHFTKLGRKYGLLAEFKENGIV